MSNDKNSILNKSYLNISKSLEGLDLPERLLIISNLLFECYPLARKADNIYNNLDLPYLDTLENHSLLKEYYNFHQESFVYITLDRAHDLLSTQIKLKKLRLNIKEE